MAALESSVREYRDELDRLRGLQGDAGGGGEALLVEIELLLATMREETNGGGL